MMEEIPGKDNYGANLPASSFDSLAMSANPDKSGQALNGAYYHRPYKLGKLFYKNKFYKNTRLKFGPNLRTN